MSVRVQPCTYVCTCCCIHIGSENGNIRRTIAEASPKLYCVVYTFDKRVLQPDIILLLLLLGLLIVGLPLVVYRSILYVYVRLAVLSIARVYAFDHMLMHLFCMFSVGFIFFTERTITARVTCFHTFIQSEIFRGSKVGGNNSPPLVGKFVQRLVQHNFLGSFVVANQFPSTISRRRI